MDPLKKSNGFNKFSISSVKRSSSSSPKSSPKNLERAYALMERHEIKEARSIYKEILRRDSKDVKAMVGLAVTYLQGDHGDHLIAFNHLVEAAHLNDPDAIYLLGVMYKRGHGVDQNISKAAEYFERIKHVYPDAMVELGKQYYYGDGVECDVALAFECFSYAAKENWPRAQRYLGIWYLEQGDNDPVNRKEHYAEALKYFRSSLLKDDPKTLYYLGLIYFDGLGVPQDIGIAKQYLRIAAKYNDVFAQNLLGEIAKKQGNLEIAIGYFEAAAKQNHTQALCHLGNFYEHGYGASINVNIASAGIYYSCAALLGDVCAQEPLRRIAKRFAEGDGVEVNKNLAQSYYADAKYLSRAKKEKAMSLAQENLQMAKRYLKCGKVERAISFFEKAIDLVEAQEALAQLKSGLAESGKACEMTERK